MVSASEAILSMPRVASIATMPTRVDGLKKSLNSMLPQVDKIFVYLDNFNDVPAFLENNEKIEIFRAENLGNLHASSRFLAMRQLNTPSIMLLFDDDMIYPPNYAATMTSCLAEMQGRTIVGVHGRVFVPPHYSYVANAHIFGFADELKDHVHVHELGCGTCAFISHAINFDVTRWPSNQMNDILFAIEAQKRNIPRVTIKRPVDWIKATSENQPDSLWQKTRRDDAIQSKMMRLLLNLY